MKKLIFLSLSLINSVMAQMAPQPLPELEHLEGQSYLFQWEGIPGRVYFIQTSSQPPSVGAFSWEFAPDMRVGTGSQIEMGFEANAANAEFFRLVYTDYSGTQDPYFADFDNDGYTNLEEALANTDPFDALFFPGGTNSGGNNGGGGNGGTGGNGGGTTNWNPPWEYKLTYKLGTYQPPAARINPYNPVGDYGYARDLQGEDELITSLTFEDVIGTNEVKFLQTEPNENHDSSDPSSTEWKFVGVVALSEANPEWSHAATEGTKYDGNLTPAKVEHIDFSGDDYYELKSDDLTETFAAPHYYRIIDLHRPVAFKRNSKPEVEAVFALGIPAELLAKTKIKGVASDGVIFPAQTVVEVPNSDLVKYPKKEATTAFPDKIKFYNRSAKSSTLDPPLHPAFEIDWQIKVGDSEWASIGSTKHQVYLTLDAPATDLRQETLFYLGSKNANGKNSIADARDLIYGEFTDRKVTRIDGTQMTYWKKIKEGGEDKFVGGAVDTSGLLAAKDGNGRCQSWSALFRDVLLAQGISADRIRVRPKSGDATLVVKNWKFVDPPSFPNQTHPYRQGPDAFEKDGIPGQGNLNPPSTFNLHFITKSGGYYYDPSYGTAAVKGGDIDKKYEDGAFEGFALTLNTTAGKRLAIRKNNSGNAVTSEVDYNVSN